MIIQVLFLKDLERHDLPNNSDDIIDFIGSLGYPYSYNVMFDYITGGTDEEILDEILPILMNNNWYDNFSLKLSKYARSLETHRVFDIGDLVFIENRKYIYLEYGFEEIFINRHNKQYYKRVDGSYYNHYIKAEVDKFYYETAEDNNKYDDIENITYVYRVDEVHENIIPEDGVVICTKYKVGKPQPGIEYDKRSIFNYDEFAELLLDKTIEPSIESNGDYSIRVKTLYNNIPVISVKRLYKIAPLD